VCRRPRSSSYQCLAVSLSLQSLLPSVVMIVSDRPRCDNNEEHEATLHCVECEESFCEACDQFIHARKKNRNHAAREEIIVQEPEPEPEPEVVQCDSDASHVAVMYCEDCEENFCQANTSATRESSGHAASVRCRHSVCMLTVRLRC
jgi:hypothetical protein